MPARGRQERISSHVDLISAILTWLVGRTIVFTWYCAIYRYWVHAELAAGARGPFLSVWSPEEIRHWWQRQ